MQRNGQIVDVKRFDVDTIAELVSAGLITYETLSDNLVSIQVVSIRREKLNAALFSAIAGKIEMLEAEYVYITKKINAKYDDNLYMQRSHISRALSALKGAVNELNALNE